MALYLSENDSYKLYGMDVNKSWESLYNLLYNDYVEGHKIGLDENLVHRLMGIAKSCEVNNVSFPQTHDDFYESLTQMLGG